MCRCECWLCFNFDVKIDCIIVVTMYTQTPLLSILDHNIVTAHVELLGRFAHNRLVRRTKRPPPIDRPRLTKDPDLRQEVPTVIEDHLRVVPPSGNSGDNVSVFTTTILQTAERVVPPQERRMPGQG